jgi:mannosyltransferase OCH1-like enzyme
MANTFFSNVVTSTKIKNIKIHQKNNFKLGVELKLKSKIPYPLKKYYNPIIPLNIYQTWHTKKLPPLMKRTVDSIIANNPAFKHNLFDDNDCRIFIQENFSNDVLKAFDTLIPGAYKADLWRYCILFKNGGIYLDIKYLPVNKFKFINLTEKEHWVLDADKNGIYNALIVCQPNNPILLKAINQVVENVKNKFYGESCLHPTGPLMLSNFFTNYEKNNFDMFHDYYLSVENRVIFFNEYLIFRGYNDYLNEQRNNKKTNHYSELWGLRKIYN